MAHEYFSNSSYLKVTYKASRDIVTLARGQAGGQLLNLKHRQGKGFKGTHVHVPRTEKHGWDGTNPRKEGASRSLSTVEGGDEGAG